MTGAHEHNREVELAREAALAACPPFRCEAGKCNRRSAAGMVIGMGLHGEWVDRYVCPVHREIWKYPAGPRSLTRVGPRADALRVALMVKWGWEGEL